MTVRLARVSLRSMAVGSMVLIMAVAGCSSKASTTSASDTSSTTVTSTATTYPAGKEQLCAALTSSKHRSRR